MKRNVLSEDNLIKALTEKTGKGAEALYDMYAKSLYGVINKILVNHELSQDACQDTFIRIWNSFDKYDATKGRLYTWMVRIARNIAIDMLRSKQYVKSNNIDDIEDSKYHLDQKYAVSINTDIVGVKTWSAKLIDTQRSVIDLIYFNGYTCAEVAEELCIPLGTVKTRCRMGISKLRSIYCDLGAA